MCDIWKANHDKRELSAETLSRHIGAFRRLGVKEVALSGGEALMHPNLWALCAELRSIGIKISLLSTGITLKAFAPDVIRHVDEVIVSLDGSEHIHNNIRGIPQAFAKLKEGVHALKSEMPSFPVTGRCVLQKLNYRDLPNIITTARTLRIDRLSFLAADVSTPAFNRPELWTRKKVVEVALDEEDAAELEAIMRDSFNKFKELYAEKFIAESPEKMLDIVRYYRGLLALGELPRKRCNAPWTSAVIEANGDVRPCFFHEAYGNINDREFADILNSEKAVAFRKRLDVRTDPVCKKCVCSLYVPLTG